MPVAIEPVPDALARVPRAVAPAPDALVRAPRAVAARVSLRPGAAGWHRWWWCRCLGIQRPGRSRWILLAAHTESGGVGIDAFGNTEDAIAVGDDVGVPAMELLWRRPGV